ncbi:MAG: L-threonylcarbamoyladenylate synthase [Bryobacterales bacterium]|nr:L-threonylcarbamoyladenylate synthase [Bryobacteraceae bacterium]MDW8355224.1 L-threonylcarbamoyladenylate synthase [Bryobacterales bacterium]
MTDRAALRRAAELIRQGRLVAFPTETVYGLGANALDEAAVRRIYEVKGRPPQSPLIVHVSSLEMARRLAAEWPEAAERLARRFWPGPLTLVLPKCPQIPDLVTAGLPSVGLRMPSHPLALELIREAGVPVAAPSANRFSRLSPTTAQHVREGLGDAVDFILDGGPTTVGIESTVLSLVHVPPRVLRPGMVTRAEIEAVIGRVESGRRVEDSHTPHLSPGLHARHYSPVTPLLLLLPGEPLPPGRGAYLWLTAPAPAAHSVGMPQEATAYAAVLYDVLHQEDAKGWDWIAVERPPGGPEWEAIHDRLERAAQPERRRLNPPPRS